MRECSDGSHGLDECAHLCRILAADRRLDAARYVHRRGSDHLHGLGYVLRRETACQPQAQRRVLRLESLRQPDIHPRACAAELPRHMRIEQDVGRGENPGLPKCVAIACANRLEDRLPERRRPFAKVSVLIAVKLERIDKRQSRDALGLRARRIHQQRHAPDGLRKRRDPIRPGLQIDEPLRASPRIEAEKIRASVDRCERIVAIREAADFHSDPAGGQFHFHSRILLERMPPAQRNTRAASLRLLFFARRIIHDPVRLSSTLPAALLCLFVLHVPAQQPQSDEEKKRLFLKAREEITTIPYTPPPTTAPASKPKPRPKAAEISPTPRPTPAPAIKAAPEPQPTPRATPLPVTVPKPVPGFTPAPPRPNIVVHGDSVAKPDEESEPPPKQQSVWSRLFGSGGGGTYNYLTASVRRAIDHASVRKGRWRYIVVHNSGTRQGNAAAFEHYHRYVRRMQNGLAYHFVIGNGTSTKAGAVEIGDRWHRQIQGGHVHSDYLNNIAIGICLVGDFNVSQPGKVQLSALEELIEYLRRRVGRIQGQSAVVRAHREINPPQWPTDCPGSEFPYRWLHSKF